MFLEVLQQRTAGTVHDAFRHAGRARRIHDVERVIKRQLREIYIARGARREIIVEQHATRQVGDIRCRRGVGHDDEAAQAGQLRGNLADPVQRVMLFARVEVAIGGEQHGGLDLAEAVHHALDAEVGRARRPGGADADGGEHRNDGFRHVGHKAHDAVARDDAVGAQRLGELRDPFVEVGKTEGAAIALFALEDQRRGIIATAQQVLGEVEFGIREPLRTGHFVGIDQDPVTASFRDDAAEIPHRLKERLLVGTRPVEQRPIIRQRDIPGLFDVAREGGEVAVRNGLRARGPKGLCFGHGIVSTGRR